MPGFLDDIGNFLGIHSGPTNPAPAPIKAAPPPAQPKPMFDQTTPKGPMALTKSAPPPAPMVAKLPTTSQPNLVVKVGKAVKGFGTGLINQGKNAVDVVNAGRQGVQGLGSIATAALTHNHAAEQSDIGKTMAAMNKSLGSSRGLYTPQEASSNSEMTSVVKPVIRGAATYAPYFVGGGGAKVAEDALAKSGAGAVERELGRRAASGITQGATSFASNLASNKVNTGKFDVGGAAKSSVLPAVLGGVLPGRSEATKAAAAKTNVDKFLNGENDNGVKPMQLAKETAPKTPSSILPKFAQNISNKLSGAKDNFSKTLEQNLRLVNGHYTSNNIRLQQIAQASLKDPANSEAVYSALENPSEVGNLSPEEKAVYDQVKQMQNATAAVKGKDSVDSNYIHRVPLGKNTKVEAVVNGEREGPGESVSRSTSDSSKRLVNKVLVDNKGNRVVVTDKGGRVFARSEGGTKEVDMGPSRPKIPDQINKSFDPATRGAMDETARRLGVKNTIIQKIRGGAAGTYTAATKTVKTEAASPDDVMLHELGHAADDKFDIQNEFFGGKSPKSDMILDKQIAAARKVGDDDTVRKLTAQKVINKEMRNLTDKRLPAGASKNMAKYLRTGDEKVATMFQAYLHAPRLFQETAPRTYARFTKMLDDHEELHPVRDMKPSLVLAGERVGTKVNPGQFMDKTGKVWNVERGTSKEIEQATGKQYIHNAVLTTAADHANTVDAKNMANFKEWIENRPDASEHMVKDEDYVKSEHPDWVRPQAGVFKGYMMDKSTANLVDTYLAKEQHTDNLAGRMWQATNSAATQSIVANPLIHGQNLASQALTMLGNVPIDKVPILNKIPAGPLAVAHAISAAQDMATQEGREQAIHEYLQAGGHIPSYGKDSVGDSAVAQIAEKMGSKLNAKAMSNIDMNIRATAFRAATKAGMDPVRAVSEIDTFLGKPEHMGEIARNAGMFYHWLQTQAGAMKYQATHPIKNIGSITNASLQMAAITYGANVALQKVTGNPNTHTRLPGELSLAHDVYSIGKDLVQGKDQQAGQEAVSVGTSHIAPVANALINQIAGKDIYTGANVETGQQRLQETINNLFAPSTNLSKISQGKMTPAEMGLSEFGGTYLPHASGNPAAPNFTNKSVFGGINTSGAKNASGSDKTGYSQETGYYNRVDAAKGSLASASDAHSAAILNTYLTKSKDQAGNSIQLSPHDSMAQWASLAGDPKALAAVAKIEGGGDNPDPAWKLAGNGTIVNKNGQQTSASKLQIYAQYESEPNGSADRWQLEQLNSWLVPTFNAEQKWFNDGVPKGTSIPYNGPLPGGLTAKDIQYPTLTSQQNNLMSQVTQISSIPAASRTAAQKTQLANLENNPALQQAYNALNTYTNNMRVAKGYSPLVVTPNESPAVAAGINAYDALPSGTGARTQWIDAHPALYSQMQDYYAASDLAENSKAGAETELQGNGPQGAAATQQQLSSAYDLGQYDIAKSTSANGSPIYTVNPSAAYASGSGGSSSSGSSSYGSYPLPTTSPDTSSMTKLTSLLNGAGTKAKSAKTASIKKSFGKGKGNYHVKKVSMPKSEKLTKLPKPKAPSYVGSDGRIKF